MVISLFLANNSTDLTTTFFLTFASNFCDQHGNTIVHSIC